jgi:tetratricopeptide (TPR) repeat protein
LKRQISGDGNTEPHTQAKQVLWWSIKWFLPALVVCVVAYIYWAWLARPPAVAVSTATEAIERGNAALDWEKELAEVPAVSSSRPGAQADEAIKGADTRRHNRNWDSAIWEYTQAIRLEPKHPAAYVGRGDAYEAKGEHEKAIADYTEAIRLKPNYAMAYNNRGIAYQNRGDTKKAQADFDQAKRLGYKSQ